MDQSMTLNGITFECPACHSGLQETAAEFACVGCQKKYPINEGIPVFISAQPYYGEIERERMRLLLQDAKARGYKAAVRDFLNDEFVYTYVADEHRAKWMELLPLDRNSKVLDVGCGWGTNTIPISRTVQRAVAIDATYERVKFVDIRAVQTDAHNVVPAVASAIELPFSSDQFDVVAFNGVLEWLGASDFTIDPQQCQMKALNQAFRVLKPGGKVYVGIENRYSLRYFLGDPDDHSFIRFTSLMPRVLANWYCKLRTGSRYFTYTHSLSIYQRMLADAGFHDVKPYYPWPTYRNPEEIVPLSRDAVMALIQTKQKMAYSFRQSLYLALLQGITAVEGTGGACHSFCFVAQKPLPS